MAMRPWQSVLRNIFVNFQYSISDRKIKKNEKKRREERQRRRNNIPPNNNENILNITLPSVSDWYACRLSILLIIKGMGLQVGSGKYVEKRT